ncbi:MAG TPA: hypothetical protein VGF69_13130 [Thermoanaerobaculia bacterium]|jgi:hypothetical protein
MEPTSRAIFRPVAIRRYNDRKGRSTLPLVFAPRVAPAAVLLVLLCFAGAFLTTRAELPAVTEGVVVRGGTSAVVLVPRAKAGRLRPGQQVWQRDRPGGPIGTVKAIEERGTWKIVQVTGTGADVDAVVLIPVEAR